MKCEINLSDIKNLTCLTIFNRGDEYYRDGLVHSTFKFESSIKCGCIGSEGSSYFVEVFFEQRDFKTAIREARCSCPYGAACKHIVALLLTWYYKPNLFKNVSQLSQYLLDQQKDRLVSLILELGQADLNVIERLYEIKDGARRKHIAWYVDLEEDYDND